MDPFIKWAGGKRLLADNILSMFPEECNRYWEPFLGGGAVFMALRGRCAGLLATLSDTNEDLITTYTVIRDDVAALNELLLELQGYYEEYAYEEFNGYDTFYYLSLIHI